MKIKSITLLLSFVSLAFVAQAQRPNFSEDVAAVVYNKCGTCHRTGEIAPMPLTNFNQVKLYGQSIKHAVEENEMPPWKADPNYRHFINENVLTTWEKEQIIKWVDNGMPQGDPIKEPAFPNFPEGSQLGTPDLVINMSEAYVRAGNNKDDYRIFVLPTNLLEDKEIAAIEFRPNNKNICHHAIIGLDTTGYARSLDAKDQKYGYSGFGGFGFNAVNSFVGGWVPGFNAPFYPTGFSKRLYKGSDLLLQMHYAGSSQLEKDSSTINIFFAKNPKNRIIETTMVTPEVLTNGPFIIPANSIKQFHGKVTIPSTYSLSMYSVLPHAHLIGKDWWIYAVLPNGVDTIPIISIPEWDFHWQSEYIFPKFVKIPGGSTIHMHATYDNTASNPENPNSPPKTITFGENTSDEMFIVFFSITLYLNGDENIPLSTEEALQVFKNKGMYVYPNPTKGQVQVVYNATANGSAIFQLSTIDGKKATNWTEKVQVQQGFQTIPLSLPAISAGIYFLEAELNGVRQTHKIVIE
jgi:hypothetical protein